jgi:uncharacterized protein YdcH (DUF465 family)
MSELNDFLKLMAEGKKKDPVAVKTKEIKQNIKEDLGGFFSQMSAIKAEDPNIQKNKKIEKDIHESVQSDLSSLFTELAELKKKKTELIEEHPQLAVEEIREVIAEVVPVPTPIGLVAPELQTPDTKSSVEKYLSSLPKQPEIDPLTKEFKTVNDKIKFLEQWIRKVQNAGPGSGAADVITLDHQTTLVTTPTYTVGRKDYYVGINYAGTVTITLPTNVKNGRYVIIKDESGRCSKFPIIVQGNVDNDPDGFILKIDNGGIQMIYRDGWRIV